MASGSASSSSQDPGITEFPLLEVKTQGSYKPVYEDWDAMDQFKIIIDTDRSQISINQPQTDKETGKWETRTIPVSQVRYVSGQNKCFHLSYHYGTDNTIFHTHFTLKDDSQIRTLVQESHSLITRTHPGGTQRVNHFRVLWSGPLRVCIHQGASSPVDSESMALQDSEVPKEEQYSTAHVTVDSQCLSVFKEQYQATADDVMYFYTSPGANVVDNVIKSEKFGLLRISCGHKHMYIKMDDSENARHLLPVILDLQARPEEIYTNPNKWVEHFNIHPPRSPRQEPITSFFRPSAHRSMERTEEEMDQYIENELANRRNFGTIRQELSDQAYDMAMWSATFGLPEDLSKVSEDMQLMWCTIEADLEDIEKGGTWPRSSIESGGLDPESGEHFKTCLDTIQEAMFEPDLPKAYSHMTGLRRTFKDSQFEPIKKVLSESDNKAVLKRIYFRSS